MGHNLSNSDLSKKEKSADKKLLSKKEKKTIKEVEKIKSKIVKILKKNKVTKAGIFGSYSRGEQKKNSDIDILVEINNPEMSLLGFIGLMHLLEETLKKKVDLVEYRAIHPFLKERILNEEIRII